VSAAPIRSSPRLALVLACAVALLAAVSARPAKASDPLVPVDLELVLAVDVSGSVDYEEAQLQRAGYVAALTSTEVVAAIRSGFLQRIAVSYVEWAGTGFQVPVMDWALIEDEESAHAFAARLGEAPILNGPWTSISGIIDFALPTFGANPFQGTRRVIDISGDGANNSGGPVAEARDRAIAAGVIINGLPIVNDKMQIFGTRQIADLDEYYAGCVIGGPGAFLVVARDFHDFARAVRRKLIFEISGTVPPDAPIRSAGYMPDAPVSGLVDAAAAYAPGCDIGERRLEQRRRSLYNQDF